MLLSIENFIVNWKIEIITLILLIFGQLIFKKIFKDDQKCTKIVAENLSGKERKQDYSTLLDQQCQNEFSEITLIQKIKIMNKLIKLQKIQQVEEIFNQIQNPQTHVYTILMKAYTKEKNLEKATGLLNKMKTLNSKPNLVTYNTYLTCIMRCRQLELGEETFNNIDNKDIITYSTYIRGLLKNKQVDQAMKYHNYVLNHDFLQIDQMYFNILINGLLKNKFIDNAFDVYLQMKERAYEHNEYSITILVQLMSKLNHQQLWKVLQSLDNNDFIHFNKIVSLFFKNPMHISNGCEIIKFAIEKNLNLREQIYDLAIKYLFKISSNQIYNHSLNVQQSRQNLKIIFDYVVRQDIKIKNRTADFVYQVQNIQQDGFQKKQLVRQ